MPVRLRGGYRGQSTFQGGDRDGTKLAITRDIERALPGPANGRQVADARTDLTHPLLRDAIEADAWYG